MSVSVSGPWALGFLAIDYFCMIRTLRGPPCGRLYSALGSTLVMCELALGIYSTSPGRKILQPVALTLRTADQGAGSAAPHSPHRVSFCPSHLGPTGLLRLSRGGLFALTMGLCSLVPGRRWGRVYLISCLSVGTFSGQRQ